jgi:hypothetical protein
MMSPNYLQYIVGISLNTDEGRKSIGLLSFSNLLQLYYRVFVTAAGRHNTDQPSDLYITCQC